MAAPPLLSDKLVAQGIAFNPEVLLGEAELNAERLLSPVLPVNLGKLAGVGHDFDVPGPEMVPCLRIFDWPAHNGLDSL